MRGPTLDRGSARFWSYLHDFYSKAVGFVKAAGFCGASPYQLAGRSCSENPVDANALFVKFRARLTDLA
jgi:hypothetical protein